MKKCLTKARDSFSSNGGDGLSIFYDERYRDGYMEEWPIEKKKRIFILIKELNLPEKGDALDFGCGNGEFTGVLRQALPEWNIYGVDISSIAINNAQKRHPDCSFFLVADARIGNKKFDFLFSHHALEHVDDIHESWRDINKYLKECSSTFHVLPCGNQGSFEYNLCMQIANGIDKESQNKFVFEDKSHLRRLTTKQMDNFAAQYNFKLDFDYYGDQFYGALDWITLLNPLLIVGMTNPINAKSKKAAFKLAYLCFVLSLIKLMRYPANVLDFKRKKMNSYTYFFLIMIFLIPYPVSKLLNMCLKFMSNLEWRNKKTEKNGSEMYLYFKRGAI